MYGLFNLPAARLGVELFNAGDYFEAHEHWEDVWRSATGSKRSFYQGLIQIAAGGVKLQRGQPRAAEKLLTKGLSRLQALPCEEGNGATAKSWLASFLGAVEACRGEAERCGREASASFDLSFLSNMQLG